MASIIREGYARGTDYLPKRSGRGRRMQVKADERDALRGKIKAIDKEIKKLRGK